MKIAHRPALSTSAKAPTGIAGTDEVTSGGLPRGRTTLLVGGSNSGKTIFALQFLVHAAQDQQEPGIFVLSDAGVTVADIYTARGMVLMGTLRWEKESAERAANEICEVARKLKRPSLDAEKAELVVRMKSPQTKLVAKQVEKTFLTATTESREEELSRSRTRLRELRGADDAHSSRK
jgi:circadian clock protein KaiC